MVKIRQHEVKGVFEIYPPTWRDERGCFSEILRYHEITDLVSPHAFVQENESFSYQGVLRGMHLQKGACSQGKLVRCVTGKVLDVIVDLRPESSTFCQHFSFLLDGSIKNMLFVPRGFAHGFLVLSSEAVFNYKVDNLYAPTEEYTISPFDVDLDIDWETLASKYLSPEEKSLVFPVFLSPKDAAGNSLSDYLSFLQGC